MTTKKRLKQKIAYLQEDNFERHEIIVRLKKEKAILSESCRLLINDNSVLVDLIDGKVPVKDKNGVTIKHFDIVLVEDYPMQGVRTVSECKTHLALVARGDVGNLLIFSNSRFSPWMAVNNSMLCSIEKVGHFPSKEYKLSEEVCSAYLQYLKYKRDLHGHHRSKFEKLHTEFIKDLNEAKAKGEVFNYD